MTAGQPATSPTEATAPHLTLRCQFCHSWNRIAATRVVDRPKCGKCGRPFLLDRPFPLGEEDFARTIAETGIPVLVDFYADWCGPCKVMAPVFDDLARRYQGRVLVAKVNTDLAPQTTQGFGIRGIPTTILFQNGKAAARQTGAVPARALEAMLTQAGVSSAPPPNAG